MRAILSAAVPVAVAAVMLPRVTSQTPPAAGFAATRVCATCHPQIDRRYRQTGMGKSFSPAGPANIMDSGLAKNGFYHEPSDTWFTMTSRGGQLLQRRYQIGFDGRETNVDEKSVDFVMGSGNHARTYLHRTPAGALQQLPLAWYAENGGYWAMNPGYDKPDQPDSRRKISYECMFCHNGLPQIPQGHEQLRAEPVFSGPLPEGIDCQRCHGPGGAHVRSAQSPGATPQAIRGAIVNPARLTTDGQMEVCMQCHLETTSFPFPHSILKYDRGPFSYRPGEPIANFMLFFDEARSESETNRFQIVNSVYRLRMSQCYLKSGGTLQCTTCHDPHGEKPSDYNGTCRQCHAVGLAPAVAAQQHTADNNCIACHMPKRRTDDVVHAVMTDHYIRKGPPAPGLLARKNEPNGPQTFYRGEVAAYYTPADELYLALAQVRMRNNIERGIPRFRAALEKLRPPNAGFYIEFADALVNTGKPRESIPFYEQALRRQPDSLAGLIALGQALDLTGQTAKALGTFNRATQVYPEDALSWQDAGQAYLKLGRRNDALTSLRKSVELDPDVPETHYALGAFWSQPEGDAARAEAAFREAIRLQPDYAQARLNLAILLSRTNRAAEAEFNFKWAFRSRPDYALAHLNYALMLKSLGRGIESEAQLKQAEKGDDPVVREAARKLLLVVEPGPR